MCKRMGTAGLLSFFLFLQIYRENIWFYIRRTNGRFSQLSSHRLRKFPTIPSLLKVCFFFLFKYQECMLGPSWCGSVDWASACEPKGCWFDSQSGHMPVLRARSPVGGAQEATTHWCFSPLLSFSCPLSLKINKYNLYKRKRMYVGFLKWFSGHNAIFIFILLVS